VNDSFIKDIGRSYIVSSLLPAFLFISLGVLVFRGFVPSILVQRVIEQDTFNGAVLFLFGVFIVWIAFALYSASDWIIRLYEGYFFPKPIKKILTDILRKWQKENTEKIRDAIKVISNYQNDPKKFNAEYRDAALLQYKKIERLMPLDSDLVMPTRFGNIILTSELYPEEKYAINSLALWTRLLQVTPPLYRELVEEKNNHMVFLLNSSFLSYCIGLLAFIIGLAGLPCQIFKGAYICPTVSLSQPFYIRGFVHVSALEYLLVSLVFLIGGYILYIFALPAAEAFGLLIRSGFDMYRFDILRQMNQRIPRNLDDEKNLWRELSEYIIAGSTLKVKKIKPEAYHIRNELLESKEITEDENTK
jgi:hypothetical protein